MLSALCAAGLAGGAVASEAATAPPRLEPDGTLSPGQKPRQVLKAPGTDIRLSNEKTLTRSAFAMRRAPIKKLPRDSAGTIERLTFQSDSRTFELYGLLRGVVDNQSRAWIQIRVPGPRNGRTGWVRAAALTDPLLVRTRLVVSTRSLRATFFDRGERLFKGPVGVGKPSTPTPTGTFFIDRKEGAIFGPTYGTNILFTNAFSISQPEWPGGAAIGIHGTSAPSLVPGRPSHGCIRMHNSDISRLADLVPVGTPLIIK